MFGKIDEEGDYLPGVTPPATAGARNLGRVMSRQASGELGKGVKRGKRGKAGEKEGRTRGAGATWAE